ncbi:magnesium and cobalt transport protein CorA [Pseudogulbenkiania sp. NH8B]|uniref:magnesium/cobalt transporter CorA n=1 Tax=Pseudogulbenkiania sp. (strain NH8B) TaxID=748280 RepID=UPI0002279A67|nr:magnesium/cobalt transporter CorA [Pseudogulbenkiania sp. NH8B]BAK77475.1 magnesium and cobalt transport protein CorA [Pseudogulbenkiania sp. NH8B]
MLINCVAYQNGKKLADLPIEQIHDYLARPDCFVWVAIRDPDDNELQRMTEQFRLHELAVEDARHGHQRPKLEEYDGMLFCALQLLDCDEGGELLVGEMDLFVGHNYVLSLRNRSQQGFQNVRARCEHEPQLLRFGAGFVFYALIDSVVDRYFSVVHRLEDELEEMEERLFARGDAGQRTIHDLYLLKRKLVTVSHAVVPLNEAVARLHGGRVPEVCREVQEYYRDVDDHLARIARTLDSLRDMLATAIQVNLAMISLDESAVSKKLASYAALFAVPTTIAGIYGMNFQNMPELKTSVGYPLALLAMLVLDLLLWWRFKRVGWL